MFTTISKSSLVRGYRVSDASRLRIGWMSAALLAATIAMPGSTMAAGVVLLASNSPSLQTTPTPLGGATVAGVIPTPLTSGVTSLTLGYGGVKQGQLLIADVMTYSGAAPAIQPPSGWQLIRDDISPTTRQTLYSHVADSNEQPSAWTFSQPVDSQGAILALDNAAASDPIDGSSGIGGSQAINAPALTASDDGDLILVFFATDFGGIAPGPDYPDDMLMIANQKVDTHAYWILGSYQAKRGDLDEVNSPTPQLYNAAASQVAIRRR